MRKREGIDAAKWSRVRDWAIISELKSNFFDVSGTAW